MAVMFRVVIPVDSMDITSWKLAAAYPIVPNLLDPF